MHLDESCNKGEHFEKKITDVKMYAPPGVVVSIYECSGAFEKNKNCLPLVSVVFMITLERHRFPNECCHLVCVVHKIFAIIP